MHRVSSDGNGLFFSTSRQKATREQKSNSVKKITELSFLLACLVTRRIRSDFNAREIQVVFEPSRRCCSSFVTTWIIFIGPDSDQSDAAPPRSKLGKRKKQTNKTNPVLAPFRRVERRSTKEKGHRRSGC